MNRKISKEIQIFVIIAILFSLYVSVLIYRTSFVINSERYFSLFDDAMVSMRYAKNLASGHGLVMNPGERVEGYTNPLWVVYMAIIHLIPVAQSKISIIIEITGAVLLVINLLFVMKLTLLISGNSSGRAIGAVFLTAFYLPLIAWSIKGMEVSLLTLIMTAVILNAIKCIKHGLFSPSLYILLGISTLIRIDMVVPFLGILLYLAVIQHSHRKRNLIWGIGIFLVFMCTQTLFRIMYYGDLLPNTYYLKMTGYPVFLRITRGLVVFWQFLLGLNLPFLVMVIVLIKKCDRQKGLLLWIFALQCLYSIYVGGDVWEFLEGSNRYISIAMPLFFILLSDVLYTVAMALRRVKNLPKLIKRYSFAGLIILSFILCNNNKDTLNLPGLLLLKKPGDVDSNKEMIETALIIKSITNEKARVAVVWAGALSYFSERYIIDILGKVDRVISREEMRQTLGPGKYTFFFPGHLKYNYDYSIGELKPDIIAQFWRNPEETKPYLSTQYHRLEYDKGFLYVRGDSENILWEKLPSIK